MSVGLVTISMWIGMTAFGALVSLVNLRASHADLKAQIGRPDQRWQRALIAKVNIANEIGRIVVHVLLFVAGVLVAWVQFNPARTRRRSRPEERRAEHLPLRARRNRGADEAATPDRRGNRKADQLLRSGTERGR